MLFFGVCDPILALNACGIGLKFFGDLLDIVGLPACDLDKRPGAEFLEGVGKDGPDSGDLLEIISLDRRTAF